MNTSVRTSFLPILSAIVCLVLGSICPQSRAQVPGVRTNYCVTRAIVNTDYISGKSGSAIWMPKISTNLIFFQPGSFTEYSDGTATLSGTVRSLTNFDNGFNIVVNLSGFSATPPPGSPKKDLDSSAYSNNGGPVDTSTWHYYTNFTGTFTGFGLYANAILDIVRYGPSFQIGVGASGKNVSFGAGAWFTWYVRQQPTIGSFPTGERGDFNLDLGTCECPVCDLLYPFSSPNPLTKLAFNESEILRQISPGPVGPQDIIKVWYNDEEALVLGINKVIVKTTSGRITNVFAFSSMTGNPSMVSHPQVGATSSTDEAQAGTDPKRRPMFPALFLTDITTNSNPLAGDWQFGGIPIPPHGVFGTWKAATRTVDLQGSSPVVTVAIDDNPTKNNWNLGPNNTAPAGLKNEGFGAELQWNVAELGLIPGHQYRAQVMVHDGDQSKEGGDVGQACMIICITNCVPPAISATNVTVQCAGEVPSVNANAVTILAGTPTYVGWVGDTRIGNGNNCYVIQRVYQATNECGSTTCTQWITIRDTNAPILTCASAVTNQCGSTPNFGVPFAWDKCDGTNVLLEIVGTFTNGGTSCSSGRNIVRTWRATDSCGNYTNVSQTIYYQDTTPPLLTCELNLTVECGTKWAFVPPTGLDNCDGTNVTIVPESTTTNAYCGRTFTARRVWRGTDLCGNSSTITQTVAVVDTTPPALACATNLVVQWGTAWAFTTPGAYDICDGTNVVLAILGTLTNSAVNCPTNMVVTRMWRAADQCSNLSTCSQTITLVDTTPPVLTCASNYAIECGLPLVFTPPAVFDNCDGTNLVPAIVSTITNLTGFTCPARFSVTRTWSATDRCGNSNTCSQTITIRDTTAPILTCATNLVVQWGTTWNFTTPNGYDLCDSNNLTITILGTLTNAVGACPTNMVVTRMWQAADRCSNLSTCSQTITLIDTTPPVLSCSTNITIECGLPLTFTPPSVFDNCDGTNLVPVIVSTTTNMTGLTCPARYSVTRTWSATDRCGNSNTCNQTITVRDTLAPALVCGADQVVECGTTWAFSRPVAYDLCDGANLTITTNTVTNLLCGRTFRATRTWTATDFCGNLTNCSQTITVTDSIPPVVTCATNLVVQWGTAWSFTTPSAYDICDGTNVVVTPLGTVTNSAVACPTNMVVTRMWRAADQCSNLSTCSQTITLVDTTPPALSCGTNFSIECGLPLVFTPPAVFDNCDGTNLVPVIVSTITNLTGFTCPARYSVTRTWSATDRCGNSNTCNQTITIRDTTAPLLTCATNLLVQWGTAWNFTTPSAYDLCDSNNVGIIILGTVTNAGVCPTNIVVTRMWRAADQCSNLSTCSQTITLVDTTAPVLTCASNFTIECGVPLVFTPPAVFDNCDGTNLVPAIVSTITNLTGFTCPARYSVTRTWSATDRCGNSNTCNQTITIRDTTPPIITCASNLVVECGIAWNFTAPNAYDLCDSNNVSVTILGTFTNAGVCPTNMVVTRMWRAADQCSNLSTCSQTITIRDTLAPALVCGADQVLECGTAWTFSRPVAFDICAGTNVTITNITTTNFLCGRTFRATRTWTATDLCGNFTNCSQSITLTDSIPPVVTCVATQIVECGTSWDFTPASAYDICDGNLPVTIVNTTTNRTGLVCPYRFTVVRTWRATDLCGHSTTCTQTVAIVDTTPPQIVCGPPMTNSCDVPVVFDTPSAFDLCDGTLVPVVVTNMTNFFNPPEAGYTVTRTWRAYDSCSNTASCSQSITVTSCPPGIIVLMDVGCLLPGDTIGSLGPTAAGFMVKGKEPAFCYRVVVSNSSSITLTNCTVMDDTLGDLTRSFFPTSLTPFPPHASYTKFFKMHWPYNTTNIVTAIGQSMVNGGRVTNADATLVTIAPASIKCTPIAYSPDDQDGDPYDPFVSLPDDGKQHLVIFYQTLTNTGDAVLAVQMTTPGLAALGCQELSSFYLPAHSSWTNVCMVNLVCPSEAISLRTYLSAVVDNSRGECSFDIDGNPMPGMTDTNCLVGVTACMPMASCRVTGGGRQETTYPAVSYMTHGGQVGAPVGMAGFDPDSSCIHGNWEVVRHESSGTKGNFHAKSFDSLLCACLTCANSAGVGGLVGDLCNPNDTDCGPGPRKAPANKITFSGVGDFTRTSGNRVPRSVIFRVDIEDRGEPGNSGKSKNDPPDRHRIRIWILTDAELARLNNPNDRLLDMRKAISATRENVVLQDGAIGGNGVAVTNGTQVFGVRTPDIDDGGVMDTGNHQIHPMIKSCF